MIYVSTEYLSGGTLNDTINSKFSHTGEKINKIFKDVLEGLSYMASKNIMHRDIKPDNIMFRE